MDPAQLTGDEITRQYNLMIANVGQTRQTIGSKQKETLKKVWDSCVSARTNMRLLAVLMHQADKKLRFSDEKLKSKVQEMLKDGELTVGVPLTDPEKENVANGSAYNLRNLKVRPQAKSIKDIKTKASARAVLLYASANGTTTADVAEASVSNQPPAASHSSTALPTPNQLPSPPMSNHTQALSSLPDTSFAALLAALTPEQKLSLVANLGTQTPIVAPSSTKQSVSSVNDIPVGTSPAPSSNPKKRAPSTPAESLCLEAISKRTSHWMASAPKPHQNIQLDLSHASTPADGAVGLILNWHFGTPTEGAILVLAITTGPLDFVSFRFEPFQPFMEIVVQRAVQATNWSDDKCPLAFRTAAKFASLAGASESALTFSIRLPFPGIKVDIHEPFDTNEGLKTHFRVVHLEDFFSGGKNSAWENKPVVFT